jgi:hypothetical protein
MSIVIYVYVVTHELGKFNTFLFPNIVVKLSTPLWADNKEGATFT